MKHEHEGKYAGLYYCVCGFKGNYRQVGCHIGYKNRSKYTTITSKQSILFLFWLEKRMKELNRKTIHVKEIKEMRKLIQKGMKIK